MGSSSFFFSRRQISVFMTSIAGPHDVAQPIVLHFVFSRAAIRRILKCVFSWAALVCVLVNLFTGIVIISTDCILRLISELFTVRNSNYHFGVVPIILFLCFVTIVREF